MNVYYKPKSYFSCQILDKKGDTFEITKDLFHRSVTSSFLQIKLKLNLSQTCNSLRKVRFLRTTFIRFNMFCEISNVSFASREFLLKFKVRKTQNITAQAAPKPHNELSFILGNKVKFRFCEAPRNTKNS